MSRIAISPERDSEMCRPRGSVIVGMSRNSIVPSTGASRFDCSLSCAAPPMWKVRIVNCVPGSPIDWAAMTPTASPMFTGVPLAAGLRVEAGRLRQVDLYALQADCLDLGDHRLVEESALQDDHFT